MTQSSKDAYKKLSPVTVQTESQQILTYMHTVGCPVNDREISVATGLAKNVVWSRRNNLAKSNKIVYAGSRLDAATGNYTQTWRTKKTWKATKQ